MGPQRHPTTLLVNCLKGLFFSNTRIRNMIFNFSENYDIQFPNYLSWKLTEKNLFPILSIRITHLQIRIPFVNNENNVNSSKH